MLNVNKIQHSALKNNNMSEERGKDLKIRTKQFALRIIKLFSALPKQTEAQIIGKQILRSGTSVGAQYREGTRARSDAEFISKIESASQELEETMYWLELLIEAEIFPASKLQNLQTEAQELMSILVSSVKTVKMRRKDK
jgi:four helix bundle protein